MKKLAAFSLAGAMAAAIFTGCGSSKNGGFDASHEINVISWEEGSGTRGAFIELFGIQGIRQSCGNLARLLPISPPRTS